MGLQLSKEESEMYSKIIKDGDMDMMFDFGYAIGRERLAKEQLEMLNKKLYANQ